MISIFFLFFALNTWNEFYKGKTKKKNIGGLDLGLLKNSSIFKIFNKNK